MDAIDRLSTQTIKAGPLKSVYGRVMRNLNEDMKPNFRNDARVTDEKVILLRDIFTTYESAVEQVFDEKAPQKKCLENRLAALAAHLCGEKPEDIAATYQLKAISKKKTIYPKDEILSIATSVTQTYNRLKQAESDNGEINKEIFSSCLGRIALREYDEEAMGNEEVLLPGFESLHNTVVDLYEDPNVEVGEAQAKALLLLFKQDDFHSVSLEQFKILHWIRDKLRLKISLSPTANDSKQLDAELKRGLEYIRAHIARDPKTKKYRHINDILSSVEENNHWLMPHETRPFIESRIAYVLKKLYTEDKT